MNKIQRKAIDDIVDQLEILARRIGDIRDEEQEYLDDMIDAKLKVASHRIFAASTSLLTASLASSANEAAMIKKEKTGAQRRLSLAPDWSAAPK